MRSSVQRGEIYQRNRNWTVRYYDEGGVRRIRGGFGHGPAARKAAAGWLADRLAEVDAGRSGLPRRRRPTATTVADMTSEYLAGHDVDPATIRKLRQQLRRAEEAFGDRDPSSLTAGELRAWRLSLPEGYRSDVFRAFKQVLAQRGRDLGVPNPADGVKNPKARRPAFVPFASWEEIDLLADEIDPRYRLVPILGAGAGLRPEEMFALEGRKIDLVNGTALIDVVYSQGVLKPCAKTDLQRRQVPLRARVLDELRRRPRRIDTPLLLPAPRGGHTDLEKFRHCFWVPALASAGFYTCEACELLLDRIDRRTFACSSCGATRPSRRIYDLRHTYATWSLAAGVELFDLSRHMGTSLREIDDCYGHLAAGAEARNRTLLDAYDAETGS